MVKGYSTPKLSKVYPYKETNWVYFLKSERNLLERWRDLSVPELKSWITNFGKHGKSSACNHLNNK